MRSSTTNAQCSGRWPGVCMTRFATEPTSSTWPSASGSYGNSGLGERMDRDGHAVLDGEASVARDVVRVRVRLEHALDADARPRRGLEQRLDRERRIDDDRDAGLRVADEIGRAAEVVVHELPKEQHG